MYSSTIRQYSITWSLLSTAYALALLSWNSYLKSTSSHPQGVLVLTKLFWGDHELGCTLCVQEMLISMGTANCSPRNCNFGKAHQNRDPWGWGNIIAVIKTSPQGMWTFWKAGGWEDVMFHVLWQVFALWILFANLEWCQFCYSLRIPFVWLCFLCLFEQGDGVWTPESVLANIICQFPCS